MTTAIAPREAWAEYANGSRIDHFAWWTEENCRHFLGPFAGKPLILEAWQKEILGEAMAVDTDDLPYWPTVILIVPRKNGKTTMFAAVGAYHADQEEEGPRVGLAATSDDQAGELFDAIDAFIAASPYLTDRFHVRDYEGEIARTDAGGYINRIRMDWRRLHGKNLSLLLPDEIHAWTTPNLRKCWEGLTTGDAARPGFQTLGITTEGEPDPDVDGILSSMVAENENYGELEKRPGLTISRNFEARVLIYRYHGDVAACDPAPVRDAMRRWRTAAELPEGPTLKAEYEQALERCAGATKLANPASWISEKYLARKAVDTKLKRSAFLRYHACIQASGDDAWISDAQWDELGGGSRIAPASRVCLGADGSRTHDSTAVAWACRAEDGRVDVDVRVFSAVLDAPHHELHQGKIDYEAVEEFIVERFVAFKVVEAAYDPRYLDRSAEILDRRLPESRLIAVEPTSRHMRDALSALDRGISDGIVRHRGDPVLRAHVLAAVADRDDETKAIRRIRRRNRAERIDAAVAVALAYWRAVQAPKGGTILAAYA